MENSRRPRIENFARDGKLVELKELLHQGFSQIELDIALVNAIAYAHIDVADFLLSIGADFSRFNFQGVCYTVQNDELEGVKYAIGKGVDINVNNGMILNTSTITAIHTKSEVMVEWILSNGGDVDLLTEDSIELVRRYGNDNLKRILL